MKRKVQPDYAPKHVWDKPMIPDIFISENDPTGKATFIRNRLKKWVGVPIQKAERVYVLMIIDGKDVRYECGWIKELLK